METEKQEVSVGVVGHDQRLIVQFSDGQFAIPAFAIEVLGGSEKLLKIAPDLSTKTFGEFLGAIHTICLSQTLSRVQHAVVVNHLGSTGAS